MNTIFHLKKALFYSTILLSLIILLEGCKKKSTVEDFGTRIDQCYEDRIDTTLMADGQRFTANRSCSECSRFSVRFSGPSAYCQNGKEHGRSG